MSYKKSTKSSPKFSGKLQPHVPKHKLTNSQAVPGPGTYKAPSSFGKQTMSRKKSSKNLKFGSEQRDTITKLYISRDQAKKQPSKYSEEIYCGTIKNNSSIGKQSVSSKKTQSCYGFGTGTRDHVSKLYVPKNF